MKKHEKNMKIEQFQLFYLISASYTYNIKSFETG